MSGRRGDRAGGLALPALNDILDEYQLVDAEDRYRLLIDLGRQLEPMPDALKTEATMVRGCSASVWVYPTAPKAGCISSPTATPRSPRASSRWCSPRSRTGRRRKSRAWMSPKPRPVRAEEAPKRQPHPGRPQHDRVVKQTAERYAAAA